MIVALVLLALAPTAIQATPAQAASDANVTKQSVACPSQEFKEFLAAFSENADLQRRYTFLPLQYGEYETVAGTPTKWRKIKKIEDIPEFNAETGLVLRNDVQRSEKHLDLNIERRSDDRFNDVIIFEKEHGYNGYAMRIILTFRKMAVGICTRLRTGLDPEVRGRSAYRGPDLVVTPRRCST